MGDHRLIFELDHESFDPHPISSQSPSHGRSANVRCGGPGWLLYDLLLCLLLLSMDQAELRNSGLNVADLQRAVVARALRPPWRCPRQAPIRIRLSHPAILRFPARRGTSQLTGSPAVDLF